MLMDPMLSQMNALSIPAVYLFHFHFSSILPSTIRLRSVISFQVWRQKFLFMWYFFVETVIITFYKTEERVTRVFHYVMGIGNFYRKFLFRYACFETCKRSKSRPALCTVLSVVLCDCCVWQVYVHAINEYYDQALLCLFLFCFLWRCSPTRAMASSILRFLDHTQRRITVGRTPLDEWSARHRYLYLTTHNIHNRQTSMSPVGSEPTISASERPQTYALDRAATGTGQALLCGHTKSWRSNCELEDSLSSLICFNMSFITSASPFCDVT